MGRINRHSGFIGKALDDIKKINACPGHEWVGPIKEVTLNLITQGNPVVFETKCKYCPIRIHWETRKDAEEAIK